MLAAFVLLAGCGGKPAAVSQADPRETTVAAPGPKEIEVIDLGGDVKMQFVLIPAGAFMMGSDTGDPDEKPAHKVTVSRSFYVGKFEVTQEQWEAVTGGNPSHVNGLKLPVEHVSWNDCQHFLAKAQKKSGRKFALPTEAQWEYACRAGSTNRFTFGDDASSLAAYGWYSENSGNTTHPVGEKKPNPWGLYDMHGNVWEWCADWYGPYAAGDATDPQGPGSGGSRVLRGGAWSLSPINQRSATRNGAAPAISMITGGFRCALPTGE